MKFDITKLDLDRAKSIVMSEIPSDEVPDVIRHHDFHQLWASVRDEVLQSLDDDSYSPRPAILHEVPKSLLATRPIAELSMVDRIVFEAVMQLIAASIDAELSDEVYSARLKARPDGWLVPRKQVSAWVKFQKAGRDLCDAYEDACLLTTDITSYFEFIDRRTLGRQLKALHGIDGDAIQFILDFFNGISSTTNLHGVPQGPEVSSLLGNIYLLPVDAALRKLDVKFIRFQDDIKVFADEPHELRKAVREVTPIIRERHLNLSSAKTRLLRGDAVSSHFEDVKKDAIQYGLDGDFDVSDDLRSLFDDAVVEPQAVVERDVRFAIVRFQKLSDDYAVSWVLEHLPLIPYLASHLVRYLSAFIEKRPDIEVAVRNYLADASQNVDPFTEMQLVRMLANAPSIAEPTYDLVWEILKDQNKSTYVRQFAARCVARHMKGARAADVALIKAQYQLSSDVALNRALLVAEYEAGGVAEKSWLNQVKRSTSALAHTCDYLLSGPALPDP